jgi:apolipoprotein N-acyltransferase
MPAAEDRLAVWLCLPVGAAVSFAFAPFGWWPLGVLATAYLFAVWHDTSRQRAAAAGFLFTAGTFLAGTYWLITASTRSGMRRSR